MPPVQTMTQGTAVDAQMSGAQSSQVVSTYATAVQPKKSLAAPILGIVVFGLATVMVVLIWLLVQKSAEYDELNDNVELKIAAAVSEAKTEQALADAEEAKKETRQFTGPTDYGQLSFDYPKSWSVYVASDASKGGDFMAYLNPLEIEPVSESTVYALRVSILNKSYESVIAEYQRYIDRGEMGLEVITVGGATASKYTGTIPNTELSGIIVIFKIRDKTAVMRTDSILYQNDFQTVLSTVRFNA